MEEEEKIVEQKSVELDKEEIRQLDRQLLLLRVPGSQAGPFYPLHLAAARGDVMAIKHMSVLGPDVNLPLTNQHLGDVPGNQTPLHLATRRGHLAAVNTLVEVFGSLLDMDAQDDDGDTCLHIASRQGSKSIVEALVDGGADPTCARNKEGKLPIEIAKNHGVFQVLQLTEDRIRMLAEVKLIFDYN